MRPFDAPRPDSYASVPPAIGPRRARSLRLPPGPRSASGLGPLVPFQRDTPGFLMRLRAEHGEAASFLLGRQLFIALFAPAMVHDALVVHQHDLVKGVGFARMRLVLGEGLLTNEEPVHLRHRRMMQAPFHHTRLDAYAALMADLTREELDRWRPGDVLPVAPTMMALTLAIVARTLFGTDARAHAPRIGHAMDVAIDRIERTMLPGLDRLDRVPLPWFRAFRRASDDLAEVAEALIAERRAAARRHGADASDDGPGPRDLATLRREEDLLGLLFALRDEDGSAFSDDEVRDEALTLILSGHETTANVLTWAFSLLATHPDARAELEAEADAQAWLAEDRAPTVAELMAAPVAGRVLAETLRLCPPVWVAPRRALVDTQLGGVAVPAGAHVLVSQYVTHRDPVHFPDPERFEPERWRDGLERRLPRGAYIPFGAGTRRCLGDQFALLEGRIILLAAAHRLRLEPLDAARPLPVAQPRATYRARGPVPMRIVARTPEVVRRPQAAART
jgi:cytochrome P450